MKDWKFLFEKYALGQHRPEWQIQKFIGKIHGTIAFDIGAYHGQYSRVFAKHFAQVIAFEPDPDAAKFLESLEIRNLRIYQIALGDSDREALLYRYRGLYCPGILETFHLNMETPKVDGDYRPSSAIGVKMGTYDDFASDATVDLVKIDVEGAEFKVLEGMKKALANQKVRRILVELHDLDRKLELEKCLSGFEQVWVDNSHLYGELGY